MGYNRFQIDCVFTECDLFKPNTFIQNFIYIDFRIIVTQFYSNFSKQEQMYRATPEILRFYYIPTSIFPGQSL